MGRMTPWRFIDSFSLAGYSSATFPSMITKCMLRASGMNGEATTLASGGSEFSDSSSSVSIDDFPANNSTTGLLTVVTTTRRTASQKQRHLTPSATTLFEAEEAGTMVTLMEASDCEDFPGTFVYFNERERPTLFVCIGSLYASLYNFFNGRIKNLLKESASSFWLVF